MTQTASLIILVLSGLHLIYDLHCLISQTSWQQSLIKDESGNEIDLHLDPQELSFQLFLSLTLDVLFLVQAGIGLRIANLSSVRIKCQVIGS